MINLLYYKIYEYSLKSSYSSIIHFSTPILAALFLTLNVWEVNLFLAKIDLMPFFFSNKRLAIGFLVLNMLVSLAYYRANQQYIFEKYYNKTGIKTRKTNIVFIIYLILTFSLIFILAFYRPEFFKQQFN